MMNFVLCDDDKAILSCLVKNLETVFLKHEIKARVAFKTHCPMKLLEYSTRNTMDVLFLDIDLKSNMDGLQIAERIRENDKNVSLIFSSALIKRSIDTHQYRAFDFISKPIDYDKIERSILRLREYLIHKSPKFIHLPDKRTIINSDEIEYITKDHTRLIFRGKKQNIEYYGTFKSIESCLTEKFVRCHKSFIVNLDAVTGVNKKRDEVFLKMGESCDIGAKHRMEFLEVLNYGSN